MATSLVKTSSILQGFPKSRSLLAGNAYYNPGATFLIDSVTVGSPTTGVTFSSIPSTYQHLQIRASHAGYLPSTSGADLLYVASINGNTLTTSHQLYGDGATAAASVNSANVNIAAVYTQPTPLYWTGSIIDILDYTNTNKNKTIRALAGYDRNGAGVVSLSSALYSTNTNAVTSISFTGGGSYIAAGSKFSLYGYMG
jgi:hypothetical protein